MKWFSSRPGRLVRWRNAAARADAIVAPTAAAADEVAEHTTIARDRIRPIHHGVDHTLATEAQVEAVQQQSFPVASARVITQATLPLESNLKVTWVLMLATFAGTFIGLAAAVARDQLVGLHHARVRIEPTPATAGVPN